ncbi:MAG: hypothetical protein KIC94_12785 [Clostridiales bacterium]|nr:hypothetical protein [Clostridiales bacterium]
MEVDNLEVRIESSAKSALDNLDLMENKLAKLTRALVNVDSNGLKSFSAGVNNLGSAMSQISSAKITDANRFVKYIEKISNIDISSINKASYSLQKMANAFSDLGKANTVSSSVAEMASSISKLGYKTSSTAISNIPKLATSMNELMTTLSKAPSVSSDVIQLTNALSNLASQGSRVRSATNAISSSTKKASTSTDTYTASTRRAASSSMSLYSQVARLSAAFFTLRSVVNTVWGSITKSMDYNETVNLFQTSLKKVGKSAAEQAGIQGEKAGEEYAISFMRSAEEFADELSDDLGLDPEMTKKYQATFAQISNAMGNTAVTADNVSRSFVMLGNDIASLWNLDTATAMEKLQSGLTGQVKPMRELGVDITNATLQQTAYNYGITDSVSKMSQAAKVQLRWLTIMKQSSVAFGDMAKTINSPSNQLRILKQQWDNLCRSIGNVFMPIVQAVLPYINALVIALRKVTDSIAAALGFETPDYADSEVYTDVSSGLDGVSDSYDNAGSSADKATASANKFKKAIMGFDQFNIISDNTNNSKEKDKNNSTADGGGGYGGLDNAINDATNGYMQKYNEQLLAMKDRAEEISDKIVPKIQAMINAFDKMVPAIAGVAAAFTTYKLVSWFTSLGDKLSWIGTPAGVAALCIGALVGLGVAIYKCWKDAKENDLAKRFGDISLSAEELEEAARSIVDNGSLDKLKITLSSWDELDDTRKKIDETVTTLKKLNMKVALGMKLDAGDEREYKEAIKDYISNCKKYAEQEQLAVAMSIELLIRDEDVKKDMLESSNKFYSSAQGDLEKLGKKLNKVVNDAWQDGVLKVDEVKQIQEVQSQMANIMDSLAKSEFEAKMDIIEMDYSGVELTPETYKKLVAETNEVVQEAAKGFDEVYVNVKGSIDAQFDAGDISFEQYDRYIKEAKEGRLSNVGEVTLNATKFNLNTLIKGFNESMKGADKDITTAINKSLKAWEKELGKFDPGTGDFTDTWNGFFDVIEGSVKTGFEGLSGETKSNLKDLLKIMEPTQQEMERQARQWEAEGKKVPESLSKGLTSTYMLQAMVGDTDAIAKLVGATMGSSPEYKKMLQTAIDNGEDVSQGIIDGMNLKAPDLGMSAEELINSIETTLTSQTEIIGKTAKASGKSIGDELAEGMDSKQKKANTSGKNLADESKSGFKGGLGIKGEGSSDFKLFANYCASSYADALNAKQATVSKAAKGVGSSAKTGIKDELSITNGQSSDFKTYGEQAMKGFVNGINAKFGDVSSAVREAMKKAKTTAQVELDEHSPSRVFKKFGEYTIEGYNIGVTQSSEDTVSTMKQWANKVKSSANGLTINPLTFQSSYKVNTQGLEGYQDLVSGNVSVGGKVENSTTSTIVIDGLEKAIEAAVEKVISKIPRKDTVIMMDTREVGRSIQKQIDINGQRYSTVLV